MNLDQYPPSLVSKLKIYKRDAKRRNIDWGLSEEEFVSLWQKPCYYCLSPIETIGLDRTNNIKGYISGNVVPCCKRCNFSKHKESSESFIEGCRAVAVIHNPEKDLLITEFRVHNKPVSTNMGYQIGHRRMHKTKEAEAWINAIAGSCPYKGPIISNKHFKLEVEFFFTTAICDIDGPIKFLMDSLQGVIYKNDKQVWNLIVKKSIDKEDPGVRIRVSDMPDQIDKETKKKGRKTSKSKRGSKKKRKTTKVVKVTETS